MCLQQKTEEKVEPFAIRIGSLLERWIFAFLCVTCCCCGGWSAATPADADNGLMSDGRTETRKRPDGYWWIPTPLVWTGHKKLNLTKKNLGLTFANLNWPSSETGCSKNRLQAIQYDSENHIQIIQTVEGSDCHIIGGINAQCGGWLWCSCAQHQTVIWPGGCNVISLAFEVTQLPWHAGSLLFTPCPTKACPRTGLPEWTEPEFISSGQSVLKIMHMQ